MTSKAILHAAALPDATCAVLESFAACLTLHPAPGWLGSFYLRQLRYPCLLAVNDPELQAALAQLAAFVPEQAFNTLFVQRYRNWHSSVRPHRDPRNNVGFTVIAQLGDFDGAALTVEHEGCELHRGDVVVLPCTIGGVQGPRHSVSAVTRGTRYAVILNTIIEENRE